MSDQNIDLSTLIKKYVTTEHITVVTFLIYGWGILYNYFYYRPFGINIISFLSLQEILIETLINASIIGILAIIIIPTEYYIVLGYI